ncbi:Phosphatidylinositol transfer protein 3, partial [Linum grandiflorum]
ILFYAVCISFNSLDNFRLVRCSALSRTTTSSVPRNSKLYYFSLIKMKAEVVIFYLQDGNFFVLIRFTRFMVFTLEVAISSMAKNVEQFVLLFDASFFRSGSAFMNSLLPTLKIVADYYPSRLHSAFLIDPPSLFSYLWKGVRPFVELSTVTTVVSSLDFEESLEFNDFTSYPRAASLRFDPSSIKSTAKINSCSSSRFSFTVSHHFDSVKPWYLSLGDTSASKVGPTNKENLGPALISQLNARSYSFAASPIDRTPPGSIGGSNHYGYSGASARTAKKGFLPSTPMPQRVTGAVKVCNPRTPRPSFLQSPALFFKSRDCHVGGGGNKAERSRESFLPFLKFYRRPYDEMVYRSKMRPPLGGLISIVSPQIRRRHVSVSQRF